MSDNIFEAESPALNQLSEEKMEAIYNQPFELSEFITARGTLPLEVYLIARQSVKNRERQDDIKIEEDIRLDDVLVNANNMPRLNLSGTSASLSILTQQQIINNYLRTLDFGNTRLKTLEFFGSAYEKIPTQVRKLMLEKKSGVNISTRRVLVFAYVDRFARVSFLTIREKISRFILLGGSLYFAHASAVDQAPLIIDTNSTPTDIRRFAEALNQAMLESRRIGSRINEINQTIRSLGGFIGNNPPFGFQFKRVRINGIVIKKLEPNRREQLIMRIIDLCRNGGTPNQVNAIIQEIGGTPIENLYPDEPFYDVLTNNQILDILRASNIRYRYDNIFTPHYVNFASRLIPLPRPKYCVTDLILMILTNSDDFDEFKKIVHALGGEREPRFLIENPFGDLVVKLNYIPEIDNIKKFLVLNNIDTRVRKIHQIESILGISDGVGCFKMLNLYLPALHALDACRLLSVYGRIKERRGDIEFIQFGTNRFIIDKPRDNSRSMRVSPNQLPALEAEEALPIDESDYIPGRRARARTDESEERSSRRRRLNNDRVERDEEDEDEY